MKEACAKHGQHYLSSKAHDSCLCSLHKPKKEDLVKVGKASLEPDKFLPWTKEIFLILDQVVALREV